jgi:hypothetical protein
MIHENRKLQLVLFPFCQLCHILGKKVRPARDPHHILGRRFKNSDDLRNLLSVCRECHEHIESSKGEVCYSIAGKLQSGDVVDLDFLASVADIELRGRLSIWMVDVPGNVRGLVQEALDHGPTPTLASDG